ARCCKTTGPARSGWRLPLMDKANLAPPGLVASFGLDRGPHSRLHVVSVCPMLQDNWARS
ncbi:MAG: hypothetical protein PHU85_20235, partial [Phycisphaerae bacterium]|nr:hypothetical protein [Phycisphaerae bacterium]